LDFNRAFQLFTDSAQSGNPEAARYLGIMHLRGKGVAKNYDKALEWFTKAADGGDELAIKNVKTLKILTSRN
jgi:TPR repeat protein